MGKWVILSALALAAPGLAQPACRLCAPRASAAPAPERPLDIEIEAGIDFSRVAAGPGGGTVEVAASGARRVSGALVDLGGLALTGQVRLTGEPNRAVRISLPSRVTLTGPDGANAEVTALATDLPPAPRLGPDGRLRFAFGGRLSVDAGAAGQLRGRIPITADYE